MSGSGGSPAGGQGGQGGQTGETTWTSAGPITANSPEVQATGYAVGVDGAGNVVLGAMAGAGKVMLQGMEINLGLKQAALVMKFDPAGKLLWVRVFKAESCDLFDLAVNAAGEIAFTGSFGGSIDLGTGSVTGQGNRDLYAVKLGGNGETLWAKAWGSSGFDFGYGVALDAVGEVVLIGAHGQPLSLDDQVFLNGSAVELFAARLDAKGSVLWGQGWGATPGLYGARPRFDTSGNVWVGGSFAGVLSVGGGPPLTSANSNQDSVFLARLTGAGAHVLSKKFDGQFASVTVISAAVDANGGVLVGGETSADVDFGGGMLVKLSPHRAGFLASFDAQGGYRWAKILNATKSGQGDNDVGVAGVVFRANGEAIAAGHFGGALDLGKGPMMSKDGVNAAFLGIYSAAGAVLTSRAYDDANMNGVNRTAGGLPIVTGSYSGAPDFGQGPLNGMGFFVATLSP